MLMLLRLLARTSELMLSVPARIGRTATTGFAALPRLGPLRYLVHAGLVYLVLALLLVYVVAPVRGLVGARMMGDKLHYDAERWLATAIYDRGGNFVGTFDARHDSVRDVNYTDQPIEIGEYTANPDHKSIPVREVPQHYWRCLVWHEDRYLGGALNPHGIDLLGVLKIPYSTVRRSLALKRPSLGVGGSTLPMQFARVIYKTPPHAGEGALVKLSRKLREWWLAPVIYHELTRGGDDTPLKQWAANHIWLAQRTGGQPLHGVEITSRIVFGKEAKDLSVAEQFVLASAVNRPIILLEGSEKLNAVRLDHWRYIAEVRARQCAEKLLTDGEQQKQVLFELVSLAGGPPDPKVKTRMQQTLEAFAPGQAKRAQANPIIRAAALLPEPRLGLREEMKQVWGFDWRSHVRGVTTTIEPAENLALRDKLRTKLATIDKQWSARFAPGYAIDPERVAQGGLKSPQVVVVAANHKGEIVRYFESGDAAPYFGSLAARDKSTGRYVAAREGRRIASTGKIIAGIAIANDLRDGPDSLYQDADAPVGAALETCAKGGQTHGRRALVSFACSLNRPVEWRLAQSGQTKVRRIIDVLGFNMPPATAGEETPPSTAAVRGLVGGSPQRVHHMAAVVLAALTGRGSVPVPPPTLVKGYDFISGEEARSFARDDRADVVPDKLIKPAAHGLLRTLLKAPLCYTHGGQPTGTLKELSGWCADRRADLKLHFAKTGTDVAADPSATVDTWVAGGIQLASGAAYSYVVLVGTGSTSEPWARNVHAAQVAAPLVDTLLQDLVVDGRPKPTVAPSTAANVRVRPAFVTPAERQARPARAGAEAHRNAPRPK